MRTRHGVVGQPGRAKEDVLSQRGAVGGAVPMASEPAQVVAVRSMADIPEARRMGREQAMGAGFNDTEVTLIVAAISEVVRNIVEYAHGGEVRIKRIQRDGRQGLEIIASDEGPGIRDVHAALQGGFTMGAGGAMGLSRARWLMDAFEIRSKPGRGTVVAMVKWLA